MTRLFIINISKNISTSVAIYRYLNDVPSIKFLFCHGCRLVVMEVDTIQCRLMNMGFQWGEKPTVKPRDQCFDTSLVNYPSHQMIPHRITIRKVAGMS